MSLINAELLQKVSNLEWKISDKRGADAIQLKDMHTNHIYNAIRRLKSGFAKVPPNDVLKRQGPFSRNDWNHIFNVELFRRGVTDDISELVINNVTQLLDNKEELDIESYKDGFYSVSCLNPKVLDFAEAVGYYKWHTTTYKCERQAKTYSYSSIINMIESLKKGKVSPFKVSGQPEFTRMDWVVILTLILISWSKRVHKTRLDILEEHLTSFLNKYGLHQGDFQLFQRPINPSPAATDNLMPSTIQTSPTKESSLTLYYIQRLEIDERERLNYSYASVGDNGIEFTLEPNSIEFFTEEEAQSLTNILNRANKDLSVEFKFSCEHYVVSINNRYLIYRNEESNRVVRFTDNINAATRMSFVNAEVVIKALALLFCEKEDDYIIRSTNPVDTHKLLAVAAS